MKKSDVKIRRIRSNYARNHSVRYLTPNRTITGVEIGPLFDGPTRPTLVQRFIRPARPDTIYKYFFSNKNIHDTKLNDCFHSVPKHGKEFYTVMIMCLIRSYMFMWRFSIEGAWIPIESVFIIFASIYNRIAFIQNTCLYTSTPERKGQNRDKVQNMMYEVRTKSKDKVRKDKTSCKQHALNRDRYKW